MAEALFKGPLHHGKLGLVMRESPVAAGFKDVTFTTDAESILVSLFVESLSGTLDVEVWTVGEDGQELKVITFPTISAPTSELVLKKAAISLDNVRVRATYSDAATFDVRAKGIGLGEVDTRLVGATEGRASSTTVSAVAGLLIPASLTDRAGVIIKNYGGGTIFIGHTLAEATTTDGYPLAVSESLGIDLSSGVSIYAVSDGGSVDVRILEAAS